MSPFATAFCRAAARAGRRKRRARSRGVAAHARVPRFVLLRFRTRTARGGSAAIMHDVSRGRSVLRKMPHDGPAHCNSRPRGQRLAAGVDRQRAGAAAATRVSPDRLGRTSLRAGVGTATGLRDVPQHAAVLPGLPREDGIRCHWQGRARIPRRRARLVAAPRTGGEADAGDVHCLSHAARLHAVPFAARRLSCQPARSRVRRTRGAQSEFSDLSCVPPQ